MTENFPKADESSSASNSGQGLNLLQLPDELLIHVLSYTSYHNISEIRRVCQTFNRMCQHMLTQGFSKVEKFHGSIQRHVKSQLPRRESERRNHSLARHVDILSAIETRLSLLNMTYMKYIDVGLCSFIPGKVLDELFRILRVLQESQDPPRAHEFLQELRDISSMAMEHFEEKIVPIVKQKIPSLNMSLQFGEPGETSAVASVTSPRQDVIRLQHQVRSYGISLQNYRKEMVDMKAKMADQKKRLVEQEKKNSDQGRIISEQNSRLQEQDKKIGDLSRKVLEYDQKFSDIFSELSRVSGGSLSSTSGESTVSVDSQCKTKRGTNLDIPTKVEKDCATEKPHTSRKRRAAHPSSNLSERKQTVGKRHKT